MALEYRKDEKGKVTGIGWGPQKKKTKQQKEDLKLKSKKKSDNKARKQGMKDAVEGKNPGKKSRIVGRAEARSHLPDDLRNKPKNRWTGRDKQRARKAKLAGMTKDTKKVNKKIKRRQEFRKSVLGDK